MKVHIFLSNRNISNDIKDKLIIAYSELRVATFDGSEEIYTTVTQGINLIRLGHEINVYYPNGEVYTFKRDGKKIKAYLLGIEKDEVRISQSLEKLVLTGCFGDPFIQ